MDNVPDPAGIMARVGRGMTSAPQVVALDLATAFDRAAWTWVFGRLQSTVLHYTTTRVLQAMYKNGSKIRVKMDGATGRWLYPS